MRLEKAYVFADEREEGVDLLNAHSPVLDLNLETNLFDLVCELIVEIGLRYMLLTAFEGSYTSLDT